MCYSSYYCDYLFMLSPLWVLLYYALHKWLVLIFSHQLTKPDQTYSASHTVPAIILIHDLG